MGLLTSLLPIAASFIPGVGQFAGPLMAAGLNMAQEQGPLTSLGGAAVGYGLGKLPGLLNQGGTSMLSRMAPQAAGQISGTANDILTDLATKNLMRLQGSFAQSMIGGL